MLALLQFDAAALPLVAQMMADGRLPTLADLRRRGTWMRLDAPLLQSAAHPTLYTGMDVRDHGLYSAFPWSSADQRAFPVQRFRKPPTVWERLTDCGRRSLVVDPYLSWAPREMAGVYLSGCHFVDRIVLPRRSVPSHVHRDLAARHGRPPRLDDVYGRPRVASLVGLRDHLVRSPQRVAAAVVDLLREDEFDLLWLTFGAAHKAGHHLWDAASVVDGPIGEGASRALRDGLESVYVAIDRAMARVLDALPRHADVIAFSPTGMGPNLSRADLLPGMLEAVLNGNARGSASMRRGSRSPIWSLRGRVPVAWRSWIASALPDDLVANLTTRLYLQADWSNTRAMAVPGENQGYVRLNLRGREREGSVDPSEADALLDAIAEGLASFRDPDGLPSIRKVERMTALADRPSVPELPDLVVSWCDRPAARLSRVESPRFGTVARQGSGSGRSGNHTDDAWAIVVPGRSRPRDLGRPAGIADIGATACELLDADRAGLAGSSLLEAA
ncbi:hypothetical protein BURK1_02178 [Burkholderiales bacterium]|nr:hypothetical protein BURK1_02178 [Burkholderiales bacterium]